MTGNEIREKFLEYFEEHGHTRVRSSPLLPANDPTLLFTNAGMNQFKDVFLGAEKREYSRATTSQKCVRAGGKHNDLDEIGKTARHHTFFEVLGNFSFGDYFKKDAIQFAWNLLVNEFNLPVERLWFSIYEDDDEALEIWNLVFMQFDRDKAGNLTPLPKPSVDTGMGLERMTAVMQHVKSNYDTDLLMPIIEFTSKLADEHYNYDSESGFAMRVIADHA